MYRKYTSLYVVHPSLSVTIERRIFYISWVGVNNMGHVRLVTFQFASVRKRKPTVEKRAYMRMETGSGFSWKLNIAFVYVCMLFIPKQQSSSYTTCCAYFWKTVVLIFIFHILSMHICMLMLSRTILLWIFHEYFPYTITWEINSKYFLSKFFLLLMGVCS